LSQEEVFFLPFSFVWQTKLIGQSAQKIQIAPPPSLTTESEQDNEIGTFVLQCQVAPPLSMFNAEHTASQSVALFFAQFSLFSLLLLSFALECVC
jgi:hypothetical protein